MRRKHFFHTFLYLLGEWTNRRYVLWRSVVPKTPDSKIGVVGSTDTAWKRKIISFPFSRGKILFSFMHAPSPFLLETSGSFFKFNSFLFIYLIIFFYLIFYSFICSLQASPSDCLMSYPGHSYRDWIVCLFVWVLWHINSCNSFNAKRI